ncbi:MAG: TIR domain-containing protein [Candidatus Competibacteraceae bacterium]|nr:TIR domain-containing protein [Candidatus Competibacteraceae bacterium]
MNQAHVFISYAREDCAVAERLETCLRSYGIACFRDTQLDPSIGWRRELEAQLKSAGAVLFLLSQAACASHWVEEELLLALGLEKRRFALLLEDLEIPFGLRSITPLRFCDDFQSGLQQLLGFIKPAETQATVADVSSHRRQAELDYLDWLELQTQQTLRLYTALAGKGLHRLPNASQPLLNLANPGLRFLEQKHQRMQSEQRQEKHYDDILDAFSQHPRVALLGEPGAGKTFSLLRIAQQHLEMARNDSSAPLPIYIRLGFWEDAQQSFAEFAASHTNSE